MLKYEEKLHFDKYYDKLQSNSISQKIASMVWGVVGYVLIYYLIKFIFIGIPDFQPWNNFKAWFALGGVSFTKADLLYFICGLILTCYATVRLSKITLQNHSARNEKGDTPKKLLTDGCYAKVRHPMYGTFIILQSGFMLSLRSFWGIIIALIIIIFQYANAVREEKKQLVPLFGEEYKLYTKNVNHMLLTRLEILALALAGLLSAVGFIF